MIEFFPDPYKDELLYSTIARYHHYSAGKDYKNTLKELFGTNSMVPSIFFPNRLKHLSSQLRSKCYSADYFIDNHTLFPLYAPFLNDNDYKMVRSAMRNYNKGGYGVLGIAASVTKKKSEFYYCVECLKEDRNKYGEAYYHRIHQAHGVYVCPKHAVELIANKRSSSRVELRHLESYKPNIETTVNVDKGKMRTISQGLQSILTNSSDIKNDNLYDEYCTALQTQGFKTNNGRIKQKDLAYEFINFYGEKILNSLNVNLDVEYHWLEKIARKPNKCRDPLKHVLIMCFLARNVESFIGCKQNYSPFGTGPWLCLNPTCNCYKTKSITICNTHVDSKSKRLIGVFECKCGFRYAINEESYKYGKLLDKYKVLLYGKTWENKLIELVTSKSMSIRQIARNLECDSKTIVKYADKNNVKKFLNSSIVIPSNNVNDKNNSIQKINDYRETLIRYKLKNTDVTRKKIQQELQREFNYLYKYDKQWLYDNLPDKSCHKNHCNRRVDWEIRDKQISKAILEKVIDLKRKQPLVRITISKLGRELKISTLLDKSISKLPMTKSTLKNVIESPEVFRRRRVDFVIQQSKNNGIRIKAWQVKRKAGIRQEYYYELDNYIKEQVEY